MDENPYSPPAASTAVESALERISLRTAAARGAKDGALIGMGIFGVMSLLFIIVILVFATLAERRVEGGFQRAIEKITEGTSSLEMIGNGLGGLTVFAAWGGIIGAIAKTLSVWSRR
jgi:hypothetical protein